MDYYEVLGVDRKARPQEIKRAYRKLARQHHPDLNPGDRRAEERFKRLTEAYEVLSDPQKRRAYDQQADPASPPGVGGFGVQDFGTAFDMGEVGPFGSFSSLFSEILGGREAEPADRAAARRGEDVTHAIHVAFFDALKGLTTSLEVDLESPCPRCNGAGVVPSRVRRPCPDCAGTGRLSHVSGLIRFASTCRRCRGEGMLATEGCGNCQGSGVLRRRETLKVNIPAGVDNGSRVRLPGKGRCGRNGGAPGDLYLITQVAPHPFFRRIGDNIHCTVPITVSEAALGTRLEVPTIDGRATIRIPPGTQNGQKFRLRGKGSPSLRGTGRGDEYVEVRVMTPRAADERSRQLLRELGNLDRGDDVRRGLFA
jgi:molecular chaperone DnaJ